MAIQTGGFKVDVIPSYTPVDPRLVAFNPGSFTNGILSAFDVAKTYDQMKAYKLMQDELAATRDKRIAATGTGYDASIARDTGTIQTEPLKTDAINAQNQALKNLVPIQGQFDVQQAKNNIALQPGAFKLAQGQQDIGLQNQPYDAEAQLASRQLEAATRDNTQQAAILNSSTGLTQAQFDNSSIDTKNQIILNRLNDELVSAKSDKERKDALEQAHIDLAKAQAEEAKARGQFDLGFGRQTGSHTDRSVAEIIGLQKTIDEINKSAPGGVALSEYERNTYGDAGYSPGSKVQSHLSWSHPISGEPATKNQEADMLLARRAALNSRLNDVIRNTSFDGRMPVVAPPTGITPITVPGLTPGTMVPVTQPSAIAQPPAVTQRQLTSQDEAALQWASENPGDPRSDIILQRLGYK